MGLCEACNAIVARVVIAILPTRPNAGKASRSRRWPFCCTGWASVVSECWAKHWEFPPYRFMNGCAKRRRICRSRRWIQASPKWNWMKCGVFCGRKNKRWIWKALDRRTRRCIAWTVGHRDAATFRQFWEKVKLEKCHYFTDDWECYAQVIPEKRRTIGKSGTHPIESNNSNTRHCLARMTRRTKVVSRSAKRVDLSMRLWTGLEDSTNFNQLRKKALSIFN